MKKKNAPNQEKGDVHIKQALLQAQVLMGNTSNSEKRVLLEHREEKFNSFSEAYLVLSGILCTILGIVSVILAIIFPPTFMRLVLAKYDGFLHWLFALLYILAVALLSIGFVFGLFYVFDSDGTNVHLRYGQKLDQELIRWTQSARGKQKSLYNFERLKLDRKYRSSYGYWRDSVFWADKKFYEDAKKKFSAILSNIPGLITQEQVNEIVADEITDAQKKRDIAALIIACYFSQYTSFETLKKRLFD